MLRFFSGHSGQGFRGLRCPYCFFYSGAGVVEGFSSSKLLSHIRRKGFATTRDHSGSSQVQIGVPYTLQAQSAPSSLQA